MPECATPPAAGSGDGVDRRVAGVPMQINLTLPSQWLTLQWV